MRLIGLFGGTFNPIHFGHLRMAQELCNHLILDEVRFIPAANPPHKTPPKVSAEHRAEMVKLAINGNPKFVLDTRELQRQGASYTIDTLISLREEFNDASLCLMMGSDAFTKLNTWHRWQELVDYCHIILVQRPNKAPQAKLSNELEAFLQENYTEDIADLSLKKAGFIHMQTITAQDISSTKIRTAYQLSAPQNLRYLTPDSVIQYIALHGLYR